MKRFKPIMLLLLSVIFVTACTNESVTVPKETQQTQASFPKDNKVNVSSLDMTVGAIKNAEKDIPKGDRLGGNKLVKLEVTVKNITEYSIPIAASTFRVLDSSGKYHANYAVEGELGQLIPGNKEIKGTVYFAIPKERVIEKVIYDDQVRSAFYEWKVEK
ncbi:DUF4352 domain-containing protein [Listeria newyorkensis]|uniref:DUF4352 domain-containing protein n=1 Tax=Listeria newyorkensis TaxID=1497681 RepID=A0A841YZN9_9LIST|nr:DUF4352 domain-containing protein [Listeria newyorkensis]MBC1458006.1 DUF4352 domain-containing protein [Listeria newyorkensis]